MKTERVLVTGAAGFVGSHLAPLLQNKGYKVTALVKNTQEKKQIKYQPSNVIVADLSAKGNWQKDVKYHNYIIHLASQISSKNPLEFTKNNVLATKNLIASAKKGNVKRIILFSSASVSSIREDMYSKTKKKQEQYIANSKIDSVIIRPSMIYGPGDQKNIGWLINLVKRLPIIPLPGGGSFGRQPVYINDICQIVLKMLTLKKPKKIYEIHGLEYITLEQMVKTINEVFKLKKPVIPVPILLLKLSIKASEKIFPNPKFTSDQIESLISGEKFEGEKWWEAFDIIPTKFKDGVRQMVKN